MTITTEISVRDQILATASRLFLTQGYNLTGINQIIEEAGVAKASLYYHFPSKEDLCVAYLKSRTSLWFDGLADYLQGIDSAEERLIKVFEYRAKYIAQNNFVGCSYIRIISELPSEINKIHVEAVRIKEQQRKYFQDLLSKIDSIPEEKKPDLANVIFLLFDGATIQCQIFKIADALFLARKAVIDLIESNKRK